MPFDDQSSQGLASKVLSAATSTATSAVRELFSGTSHALSAETAVERQIKDLSARYDKQSDMESGGFTETKTFVLDEHSTAVPFSATLLTSVGKVATSVRERFHSHPEGRDLEAGPELDWEDEQTKIEEKNKQRNRGGEKTKEVVEEKRQTPEEIV